jgi:hypothetical protein
MIGPVRRAEATPSNEVGARRDSRGRVDLQQGQLLHNRDQLGRPRRIEQLRPHRDPPGLRLRQPMHRQEASDPGWARSPARAMLSPGEPM